jgi:glycine C-acetyltransferase
MEYVYAAARYRYENSNMEDLEQQLIKATAAGSRFKLIVTDGVFYGWTCCAIR